ncbi:HEAT repeat domain-containing protein [Croceivirga thetidis]|uniref:HEAT repeat domain-containing protein n=1 Tax=Croceivirga thetidis TaxID=2721623 RepID=A0ABX1GTP2_9FLAO|nr:hypothetical protein [Croceivirga thetidis]NKI32280.1 hypothetical protein [Croceivirga thetidis]
MAPVISNFLFHSHDDPIDEQRHFVELKIRIREKLRASAFKKALTAILFDLQKDVSGETRQRLVNLYRELELHHDAMSKLKSWRWEVVSQGILELTQMEVIESYNLIAKLCKDQRKTIRKQAEIAIVQLKQEGIKHILDNSRHPISEWQQLKLIEAIGNHSDFVPPAFKFWLLSENNDVVLFALRLIRHYNQSDAEGAIVELIKHKNDQIKIAALNCIRDFNFKSSLPTIKRVFWHASNEVKIQLLDTIASLGTVSELIFLEEVKDRVTNHQVKSKALGAINIIRPDSVLPTKDIESFDSPKLTQDSELVITEDHQQIEVEFEVEPGDGISPIMRSTIEFTEIEVYDVVEHPKKSTETENPISGDKTDEIFPEFELNLLDGESNHSLENHIGLVNSANEEGFEKDFDKQEFEIRYEKMNHAEREKFLNSIVSYGDAREKYLLESIVDLEENSELRFRAFGKLKQLQSSSKPDENIEEKKVDSLTRSEQSIFSKLFEHAADLESQLLLLNEISSIGDVKETVFLKQLLEVNQEDELVEKIEETLELIEERLSKEEVIKLEPLQKNHDFEESLARNDHNKMPLELLSLNEEIGISSPGQLIEIQPEFELEEIPIQLQKPLKRFYNG